MTSMLEILEATGVLVPKWMPLKSLKSQRSPASRLLHIYLQIYQSYETPD